MKRLPFSVPATGAAGVAPELLPLPYPSIVHVSQHTIDTWFQHPNLSRTTRSHAALCWLYLCIQSLNRMHQGPRGAAPSWGSASAPQQEALKHLHNACIEYIGDEVTRSPTDWPSELGKKSLSYWGGGDPHRSTAQHRTSGARLAAPRLSRDLQPGRRGPWPHPPPDRVAGGSPPASRLMARHHPHGTPPAS